jgi:hypothetical protein
MIKTCTFRFNSLISIYIFIQCIFLPGTLHAERPMFTDDPNVSPYRVLTLELGNHFDILRSAERPARYINWFDINLVYGIAENYEITVHIPAGIKMYESVHPDRSEFGSDDLSFAMKRVWRDAGDTRGTGIEGRLFFPVESKQVLGSAAPGFWLNGMADFTWGGWIIRTALGFMAPFESPADGSVMAGLAARTAFYPVNFGFVELFTEVPATSTGEEIPLQLMIGGGIGLSGNTVLDAGILFGLTGSTVFPGTGFHVGITLEI